jgi:hypothetical protein
VLAPYSIDRGGLCAVAAIKRDTRIPPIEGKIPKGENALHSTSNFLEAAHDSSAVFRVDSAPR